MQSKENTISAHQCQFSRFSLDAKKFELKNILPILKYR